VREVEGVREEAGVWNERRMDCRNETRNLEGRMSGV
jgi:hypothetical protein